MCFSRSSGRSSADDHGSSTSKRARQCSANGTSGPAAKRIRGRVGQHVPSEDTDRMWRVMQTGVRDCSDSQPLGVSPAEVGTFDSSNGSRANSEARDNDAEIHQDARLVPDRQRTTSPGTEPRNLAMSLPIRSTTEARRAEGSSEANP